MPGLFGRDVPIRTIALDEVDSTNAEAIRRAVSGERGPLWITATRQSAGRGRSGRTWGTPGGNLAATLLFTPACLPSDLPGLSLVAGVAAFDTVTPVLESGAMLRLKWPNDLLLGDGKLSGILIESTTLGRDTVVAIGTGINVATAPLIPGRQITCLHDHGAAPAVPDLARNLLANLTAWLDVWACGAGLVAIRTGWLERAGRLGEPLTVNAGAGPLGGTFAGLDPDGALRLQTDRGIVRVTFGDVSVG